MATHKKQLNSKTDVGNRKLERKPQHEYHNILRRRESVIRVRGAEMLAYLKHNIPRLSSASNSSYKRNKSKFKVIGYKRILFELLDGIILKVGSRSLSIL